MAAATLNIPLEPAVAQAFYNSNSLTQQAIQQQGQYMVSSALGFFSPSVAGASNRALYAQDFYAWTQTTAAVIRAGAWYDLDREALAEEVESLGISQQHALESHLRNLVIHLLKWHYQPSMRQTGHSWEVSIINARDEIAILTENSTLLRNTVPELLPRRYPAARRLAAVETGIPLRDFPETCPWTAQQVLDADFWPDAPPESQTSDTR